MDQVHTSTAVYLHFGLGGADLVVVPNTLHLKCHMISVEQTVYLPYKQLTCVIDLDQHCRLPYA